MLSIEFDEHKPCVCYPVTSVTATPIDNDWDRMNITVYSPKCNIHFYVASDTNENANTAVQRFIKSKSSDIKVALYPERNYIYIIDLSLPEMDFQYQKKFTGRFENFSS